MRLVIPCLAALLLCASLQAQSADTAEWKGRKLVDYLDALNERGLAVIYSSDLVGEELLLDDEPSASSPGDSLNEVLKVHGLKAIAGPAGSLLVIPLDDDGQRVASPKPYSAELPIPEIVVSSSLHRLKYEPSGTETYLDREFVNRIPAAAEEAVRVTSRLPGTAGGGISSRNHIRGGEENEVLFVLDGLRLYQPYHLRDFQSIATIVNSSAVGGIDFYTGAYPARYGDRMSGVMDIELRKPQRDIETEISVSFFNASVLSLGQFGGGDRGEWLAAARRGNLDLIVDVVKPELGSPAYSDYLMHVAWDFGPRARVSANVLQSHDKVTLLDDDRGERTKATYENAVAWFKWQADWAPGISSETTLSTSSLSNRRSGSLDLPGIVSGSIDETRDFGANELRQEWTLLPSKRWMLRLGFDIKDMDATYRLVSRKTVLPPFDTLLGNTQVTINDFRLSPGGEQYAGYAEVRWQPTQALTVDLGLRIDQQDYTIAEGDRQDSPRAGFLYRHGDDIEVRFGWGQFYQAQEINELQLSDGIAEFFPAQRAEHFVLNLKRHFAKDIDVDLSVYRKSFRTIRPRFENVFNTRTLLPELQFDRVRIDADAATAIGAELALTKGSSNEDLLWWLSYAWSQVEDRTAEGKVPRSWDQTHTVKAGMSWKWGAWDFSAAGEVHTGWPKSVLQGELLTDSSGNAFLELSSSRRNANRHSVFRTLDARVSRNFDVRRGKLTAFFEVTNLYDRNNGCCTEYSVGDDGNLRERNLNWLPTVPSLGVVWQF